MVEFIYRDYLIRDWREEDRDAAANLIRDVLAEYNLAWQPEEADADVMRVEQYYWSAGGEFWTIEHQNKLVGTAAYYPIVRGNKAVEIRKMYLLPIARGKGLGKYLLQQLETRIASRGFKEIWIETASILQEAVYLYERSGYQRTTGVETKRCDRIYCKQI